MTTIQPISIPTTKTPNFKGIKTTEKGVQYHHTNTGTIVGGTVACLSILQWLSTKSAAKELIHNPLFSDYAKKINKFGYLFMGIAAAASLGCGMLVDHLRNKNAKETAEEFAINPNLVITSPNMEYSESGLPYFKTKTGTKLGALLGAACGMAHGLMAGGAGGQSKTLGVLTSIIPFALGGLAMGALTDKLTNNSSKKAAMQMYMQDQTIK